MMDFIFELLLVIVIIRSLINKFVDEVDKNNQSFNQDDASKESNVDFEYTDLDQQKRDPASTYELEEDKDFSSNNLSRMEKEIKQMKKQADSIKKKTNKNRVKNIINSDTLEEDILRGVIFKEIIDKPRSKKPYKFRKY